MNRNKSTNNRSNKGKSRGSNRFSEHAEFTSKEGGNYRSTNDPSWYNTNTAISQSAAALPFNIPAGADIHLIDNDLFTGQGVGAGTYATPGMCILNVVPSFGTSSDTSASPLNIAAQAFYSYVRHANSGSRNYDYPDLMTYVLAMSQVYSFINWMQRCYGVLTKYSTVNRYYGKVLASAMHLDYDDFIGELANFNYFINLMISKAAAFAVPSKITLFKRSAFMFSNIYCESTDVKDQLYFYNPKGFYVYTFDTSSSPVHDEAYLKFTSLPSGNLKLVDIINYGNAMLQPLLDSEDIGIASGDILKAYGSDILSLATFPIAYTIEPIFDPMVLEQMHNATVLGGNYSCPDLYQDDTKGCLIYEPSISTVYTTDNMKLQANFRLHGMTNQKVLTTVMQPSADVVMEDTRLMATTYDVVDDEVSSTVSAKLICGSEVVDTVEYYTRTSFSSSGEMSFGRFNGPGYAYLSTSDSTTLLRILAMKSQYKYAPGSYLALKGSDNGIRDLGYSHNTDSITLVDDDELSRIHEAAMVNMIAVTAIGLPSGRSQKFGK